MQSKPTSRIGYLAFVAAIVLGMTACDSGDDSGKSSSDTSKTAAMDTMASSNAADSAARIAKSKKKKGKTSFAMPVANNNKIVKDEHGVYNRAETMPAFPGGQTALSNYINNNLNYTQTAIDNNTSGTIQVSFIVDEHGKVVDPQVVGGKTLGNGLDEETMQLFNNMPVWTPGKVKGKNVKTRLEIPITFQLEDA
ncbi:MAG TPA: TonB family protein [Puia sp.]|jgi:TonB family protein